MSIVVYFYRLDVSTIAKTERYGVHKGHGAITPLASNRIPSWTRVHDSIRFFYAQAFGDYVLHVAFREAPHSAHYCMTVVLSGYHEATNRSGIFNGFCSRGERAVGIGRVAVEYAPEHISRDCYTGVASWFLHTSGFHEQCHRCNSLHIVSIIWIQKVYKSQVLAVTQTRHGELNNLFSCITSYSDIQNWGAERYCHQ